MTIDPERDEEEVALSEEEAEAAASEAAAIGGAVPDANDDPAQRPLEEAGQGEAEGFELAERDLEDIATHGGRLNFPEELAPAPEEDQPAVYGEPDEETKKDA